jgi:hypothetical protein
MIFMLNKIIGEIEMKKIVLYVTTGVLIFAGCDKLCKYQKRPKDLKSIDWNNYNNVHTVYWNCYAPCAKRPKMNDTIMIYGWLYKSDMQSFFVRDAQKTTGIAIIYSDPVTHEQVPKFLDTVVDKKCFVRGLLKFNQIHRGYCCSAIPVIQVMHVDDIYVE